MKKFASIFLSLILLALLTACDQSGTSSQESSDTISNSQSASRVDQPSNSNADSSSQSSSDQPVEPDIEDGFVRITGGTFTMGSPESEAWRGADEIQHSVTVSDFYMSPYELTQSEYESVMGNNPSNFNGGDLPVENITWLDAVAFCNAYSEEKGLEPVYTIDGQNVSWDRGANGYRLPTEAEWEYACRAGTTTPFYIPNSPGADDTNFYGHYPYGIEDNYFSQDNLEVKPGVYRQTTVAVGSFSASPWGLYDMYGNVSEWTWDIYGAYPEGEQIDPTGSTEGTRRVYRGGGWNDFAKNMRSAYRAMMDQTKGSFNIGIRLVRNAVVGSGSVAGSDDWDTSGGSGSNVLIAYFSWGGNTRGIAQEIQRQTGADLFEITLVHPYSDDYNTVLDEAQRDQNVQARPELSSHVENMADYDTVILGYPNWWASIPMPIASFLEEYDFSGKTIIPFCSHGGGRFGQSITAIEKLVPGTVIGEGLSVHYSGGSTLDSDISQWLDKNGIARN